MGLPRITFWITLQLERVSIKVSAYHRCKVAATLTLRIQSLFTFSRKGFRFRLDAKFLLGRERGIPRIRFGVYCLMGIMTKNDGRRETMMIIFFVVFRLRFFPMNWIVGAV